MTMEFVPILVAAALVYSLANLVKQIQGGAVNEAVTQMFTWICGIGVTFLLRASDFAENVTIGSDGYTLSTLNPFSTILVGIALASTAGVIYDTLPKSTPSLGTKVSASDDEQQPGPPRLAFS